MLMNTWAFTKTVIEIDKFLQNTGNHFRVVTQRPYRDRKGSLPDGVTLTLMVLEDKTDYGLDKETGEPRDNNVFQTFDVTICCGNNRPDLKKGDVVSLKGFMPDNSFAFDYNMILRFKEVQKIEAK